MQWVEASPGDYVLSFGQIKIQLRRSDNTWLATCHPWFETRILKANSLHAAKEESLQLAHAAVSTSADRIRYSHVEQRRINQVNYDSA